MSLLAVKDLSVKIGGNFVLDKITFELKSGEILALTGESGSGKSMTALALMQLLPQRAACSGSIRLEGKEIVGLDDRALCSFRGAQISMVFQEPMTALNPVKTIGNQVMEALLEHGMARKGDAYHKAAQVLERVGLPPSKVPLNSYPHQLSGGQRQRVVIAMAIALRPKLLIADEPTTALDVTTQAKILELLKRLAKEDQIGMILITHDLAVVAGISSRICVMYAGRIVEQGPNEALIGSPMHPYTNGLLGSVPSQNRRGEPLQQIEGIVPSLLDLPPGCAFENRCSHAVDACSQSAPDEMVMADQRILRCFNRVRQDQT